MPSGYIINIEMVYNMIKELKYPVSIITVLILFSLVILTICQIVLRSFFSVPLTGAEEMARYFLICIVFLGIPVTSRYGEHVQMTEIYSMLPKTVQRIINILTNISTCVIFGIFFWSALIALQQTYLNKTTNLGIPYIIFLAPTIIGLLLMTFEYVKKSCESMRISKPLNNRALEL